MIDLDENNIDDEPFDGNESVADAATPSALAEERRAFQETNLAPEPKSDVARLAEREAASPVVAAPPPAPALSIDLVEKMIERVVEKVAPRPEPAPAPPPPPPEPTLVEQFDRDEQFYRAAMEQAGYKPDDKGQFTREAMTAVRAHLRLADKEKEIEGKFTALEQQRENEARNQVALSIQARLEGFEPLSAMQMRMLGQTVGTLIQGGQHPQHAIEAALQAMGPILRPKAAPAPAAPQARGQMTRRPASAADRIVATPGMSQTARRPDASPEDRLAAARRAMAEKLTTRRR